jgi:hypothetical protein
VEVRQVVAVDVSGVTYQAMHARGSGEAVERVVAFPGGELEPGGVIVEALDRLMTTLAGMPARTRPDSRLISNETGEMN